MNKLMKSILIGLGFIIIITIWNLILDGGITVIVFGIIGGIVIACLEYSDNKDGKKEQKEKAKQIKENMKVLSSEQIRETIKYNKTFNEFGESLIIKRKELILEEKVDREFYRVLSSGMIIMLLGIFYLGAIPGHFNVNNEMVNPTNVTLGLNSSMERVSDAGVTIINGFASKGAEYPTIFFWLFWLVVFWLVILPLLKIIYYTIRSILKGGKK